MIDQPVPPTGQTVKDQTVATDGQSKSVSSFSSQTVTDPNTGSTVTARSTSVWSGRDLALDLLWFVLGVVALFLAGDFIFHLAGANDVGFVKFVYGVGSALAKPFSGIFKNAASSTTNIVVWADVLAAVVYAIIAGLLAKLYSIMTSHRTA